MPVGTLFAYRATPHPSLNPRDQQALDALAEVATPLLQRIDAPAAPAPRQLPDLASVAGAVSAAHDVEQISRPLLDALHELTGLASSYLTVIHPEAGQQEIRFARNTRPGFTIPEGLHVPWEDTLCKRALDEGRPCVTDVPGVWGDSEAAAAIGIQVYVSVPVELAGGQVWGTLCAADAVPAGDAEVHVPTMRLFARLIAAEVDRAVALTAERHRAAEARKAAETDALTGCASRRVVEPWLVDQLAQLAPHEALLLAYADIDAFKQVNDGRGHAAGDAVLVEVGRRLREAARPDDLVARLGGDEFLVAARLPALAAPAVEARLRDLLSFELSWQGEALAVAVSVGCTTSRGGEASDLLAAADRSMYARKRRDSSPDDVVLLSS
jgi:diguanylate cyclase